MMRKNVFTALGIVTLLGCGIGYVSCTVPVAEEDRAAVAAGAASLTVHLSGAIFTTAVDGSRVNQNIYESKEAVYLDGGPGPNAPVSAAGLPEGNYYFQVTDPSGKDLLSSDHISCRKVHVNMKGVIDAVLPGTNYVWQKGSWVATPCQHKQGVDKDHANDGAITVQLFPYDNTPNQGGVYKVWLTRVEDYQGNPVYVPTKANDAVNGELWLPANAHGFVPSASKTDNFKVKEPGKPCEPTVLTVRKFHDANVNGVKDTSEPDVDGWGVGIADPLGATNHSWTPVSVMTTPGTWTVVEDQPNGTLQTASFLDGQPKSAYPTASPTVTVQFLEACGEKHEVLFGDVGVGRISACKVYDRDADGQADEGEPPVPGWIMTLTGTAVTGASIGPIVGTTNAMGCAYFPDLLPGSYTVTETVPTSGGWVAVGETVRTVTIASTVTGSVMTGTSSQLNFTNYCTGSAAFGTKGYWHNKNGLAEITADDIAYVNSLAPYKTESSYFDAGDEPFDGKTSSGADVPAAKGDSGEEAAPAGTPKAEISAFLIDANAGGDPREQLAQQLLAFLFNARHRLDSPSAAIKLPDGTFTTAASLIQDAIRVWESGSDAERTAMASKLDGFNNNQAVVYVHFTPCTVPPPAAPTP